jgi:hypothetical protein
MCGARHETVRPGALLARGARPDRADADGRRAIDYAEAMGAERAAAALREAPA